MKLRNYYYHKKNAEKEIYYHKNKLFVNLKYNKKPVAT